MEIVLRTVAIFIFILVLTRLMGKKELSELSAFELILFITIGDLVQQGVTQEDQSVTGSMLAVGTIALMILGLSYIGFRWPKTKPVVEGIPVVVVREGEPIEGALKMERFDLEDLLEGARQQGIGDLAEVKVCILEPDGQLSFIKFQPGEEPHPPERKVRG